MWKLGIRFPWKYAVSPSYNSKCATFFRNNLDHLYHKVDITMGAFPPIYLHWDFRKFWHSPVWNIQFDELNFFPKVDTFLLTFKNLSMGWGKQKKLLIRYMWFFLTKHGLFTSYTCLIGEKWVNVFAQKTMVLLSKCSKLIEVRWENCYWKK